jgi:predicted RNase H-like HicB family nuclease
MTAAGRYVKIVEWSDEDGVFVGQCPGVIGPCCHGADEVEVYRQLCEIVSEWLELADRDGTPLPPPTAGRGFAQKIAAQVAAADGGHPGCGYNECSQTWDR